MSYTQFQATDNVRLTDHATQRWRERGWDGHEPEYGLDVAWRMARQRAIPWGHRNATFARYHTPTDLILLAQRHHLGGRTETLLVTCVRAEWRLGREAVGRVVREAMREDYYDAMTSVEQAGVRRA